MPTRFKYAKVQPQSFALTPAEILLATDAELNQYMGIKKYAPYRRDGQNWDQQRATRLGELKKKIAERRAALQGGSGGGGAAAAAASEKTAKKRKGKKERMRDKAAVQPGEVVEDAGAPADEEEETRDEVKEKHKRKRTADEEEETRDRVKEKHKRKRTKEGATGTADGDEQPSKKKRRRHKKAAQNGAAVLELE